MKPEIKERVEKIRRGEVPEGYKKTKVGIIPDEWEPKEFNFVFEEKINLISDIKKYPLHSLTIQGGVEPKTKRYERSFLVTKDGDNYKIASKDDFVYNPMNLRFGAIGRHRIDSKISVSGYYNVFQCINGNDPLFMEQFLRDYRLIHLYNKYATGSLIEKKRVHFSQFLKFKLSLPKPKEQQKIAKILSTWDKAIELKEKLIEEEKEFKRGLMQKLLTGDMRFQEFSDEWEEVKISKLLVESCVLAKEPDLNQQISVKLHLKGVFLRKLKGNEVDGATTLYDRKAGQFIYGKQNFHNGAFGIIPKELDNHQTSSDIPTFDFKDKINSLYFFYYWFQKNKYLRLEAFTTGTGSKRLNPKIFLKMHMTIPSINEQNEIVSLLNKENKNIELLQEELNELKEQKRGLMQLLLTGIVRVEVD